MILIEMFRGTMSLSTRIFTKFFAPKGGGKQTKENFELLQLQILKKLRTELVRKLKHPKNSSLEDELKGLHRPTFVRFPLK